VDGGADGDVGQGEGAAGRDGRARARPHPVARRQPRRRQDVGPSVGRRDVGVGGGGVRGLQQGEAGGAVGVVLDADDVGVRDGRAAAPAAVALLLLLPPRRVPPPKVDHPVHAAVPPPRWRTVTRPSALRPPVRRIPIVSGLCGPPFHRASRAVMTRPRKPGVVGRYAFRPAAFAARAAAADAAVASGRAARGRKEGGGSATAMATTVGRLYGVGVAGRARAVAA